MNTTEEGRTDTKQDMKMGELMVMQTESQKTAMTGIQDMLLATSVHYGTPSGPDCMLAETRTRYFEQDNQPEDGSSGYFYLCGPMTGYDGLNHIAFHRVAKLLRRRGYNIVNPAELDTEDGILDYHECLRRDLYYVIDKDCKGLICIEGWEESNGAQLETYVATKLGKLVYLLGEREPIRLICIDRDAALAYYESTKMEIPDALR